MAYEDFKDLARRTASDKVLRDKAFNIAKNSKYDRYQRGIPSMVYKSFGKKSASLTDKSVAGSGVNMHANSEHVLDLTEELRKQMIRNFLKRTGYQGFKDNIWDADLADVQLISKFNKRFRFYCALLIFLVNMFGLFL